MIKRLILAIILLLNTLPLYPINYSEGLSHLNVKCIIQDSEGFMWFGTRNKLNRFDGISMKTFDCFDKNAEKRNNNINALFENSDNKLWLGTDNGVFIFDATKEQFSIFDKATRDSTHITQWVADIQCDKRGDIWIVVPNQGVFQYDTKTDFLTLHKVVENFQLSVSNPECIAIDEEDNVWIGSNASGVYRYNAESENFTLYLGDSGKESLSGLNIYTMCHYGDYIIIGIHEGVLMRLNKRTNTVETIHTPEINNKIIRDIKRYDSTLWVATQDGLYSILLEGESTKWQNVTTYDLPDRYMEKIYRDTEGGIWVATYFSGVNLIPNNKNVFELYSPTTQGHLNSSNRAREIIEGEEGVIWMGTENAGLFKFDTHTNTFSPMKNLTHHKLILAMLQNGSELWVGHFKGGLDIVSKNSTKHFNLVDLGLNEESLFALYKDSDETLWMGNGWGVYTRKRGEAKFTNLKEFGLSFTYDILEDSEGYMWITTMGNGVFRYDKSEKKATHFTLTSGEGLSSNSVSSVTEDYKGQLWFATDRGGICVYNKQQNKFTTYSIKDGLPDDITYKILEDKSHNLWFGTNNGLVCFNPETLQIKVYTQFDGLPSNQFNHKSALANRSGKLYFGTLKGLISFDPSKFEKNMFAPPVRITRLSVFNEEVSPNSESLYIPNSILYTDKVTLKHNQSNINLGFASLSYTSPAANSYAYIMEGADKDWTYTKSAQSVSYTNLSPGKYTFKVKGSNNDELWSDKIASITINILPPWWRSNIAYLIYFILFTLAVYYIFIKNKKRNAEKRRVFEMNKEKEFFEAKINFFTNIAHEIRTPVTLISGPLESIMSREIKDKELQYNIGIMSKNTNQLLTLINQLLDFRKVDSNKFTVNIKEMELIESLKESIGMFEEQIKINKLELHLETNGHDAINASLDRHAMAKILRNLLSNAVKHAAKMIDISIDKHDDYFTIKVTNDGNLIPEESKNRIFEPFYQVENAKQEVSGSGIGLSLARSLAEIQNGHLHYNDDNGVNNFYLQIPLVNENISIPIRSNFRFESSKLERNLKEEEPIASFQLHSDKKRRVLIVEDNKDMLHFLSNELKEYFTIITAVDGEKALRIVEQQQVDVVISDVMMPNMNGFELCQHIKESSSLKNILVVLLTAKNDTESKIHGLKIGADAYIEKPFSIKHIITLVTTLIENQQKAMDLYMERPFLPMQQPGFNKADMIFMETLVKTINENIDDSNFNVERVAEAMNLSRSSLHRRLKATIDSTPTDFIRLIRLQKAAKLISEGQYRINEVCYLVGINSPSYFIKLFQSQYGMTPKEYENSLINKELQS